MFAWQKDGAVQVFRNGQSLGTFLSIASRVNHSNDRGLMGFALDPDFPQAPYVYLAYVFENGGDVNSKDARTARLSRFTVDPNNPDRAMAASEEVILGKENINGCPGINQDCIPNDTGAHNIDHLEFGPDGKLYVSVGDGANFKFAVFNALRAQNLDSLNGKLLRINKDGSGPSDNPFHNGNANANRSKVYAYGFRNPFRFTFSPDHQIYVGDVGNNNWEEIDLAMAGRNFGWPCYEGQDKYPAYQNAFPSECASVTNPTPPAYTYSHDVGSCIIMGQVYSGTNFPGNYQGTLFFADYAGGYIKRAVLDSTGNVSSVVSFASVDAPVSLTQGPDGYFYVSIFSGTFGGEIRRIKSTNSDNEAPQVKISANPTSGSSPLNVVFSSAGTKDPDGDTLKYSWDFGDGGTSTLENPSHTYNSSTARQFTATLMVEDLKGAKGTASVTITSGSNPPDATILTPSGNIVAKPGQVIQFQGGASDMEDGVLPGSALRWVVLLHHNTHIHTVVDTTGTSGSFTVENHDPAGVYSYEIVLIATDSSNLQNSKSVNIAIDASAGGGSCVATVGTVKICSPTGGSASSPIRLVAGANTRNPFTGGWVYLDNKNYQQFYTPQLDTQVTTSPGLHTILVKAWDRTGAIYQSSVTVTVGSSGGGSTCNANAGTLIICAPANGSTVSSPTELIASAKTAATFTAIWVYVDNVQYQRFGAVQVNAPITLSPGKHTITVKAWDVKGAIYQASVTVTAAGSSGGGPCTASAGTVKICTPTSGTTTSSPVQLTAAINTTKPFTGSWVYIDNVNYKLFNTTAITTQIVMSQGKHVILVKAWDNTGAIYSASLTVTVGTISASVGTGCLVGDVLSVDCAAEPVSSQHLSDVRLTHLPDAGFISNSRNLWALARPEYSPMTEPVHHEPWGNL